MATTRQSNAITKARTHGTWAVRSSLDDVHAALNAAVLHLAIASIDRTNPHRRELQTALGLCRSVRAIFEDVPAHAGDAVVPR